MQEKTWYYEKWVGRQASFSPSRYVKVDYTSYIMYMDMPPVNTELGISTEGVHIT